MSSDRKNTGSNGHLINKHTIVAKWLLLVKVSACLLYIAYTHNTLHKHKTGGVTADGGFASIQVDTNRCQSTSINKI